MGEGKQVSLWEGRKGTRDAESRNDPEHYPMPWCLPRRRKPGKLESRMR